MQDFEKWIDSILASIKSVSDKQDVMNTTLIENTSSLKDHMRRSDLLEIKIDKLEIDTRLSIKDAEDDIKDINSLIDKVKGSWKLILMIGTIVGLTVGVMQLLKW